MATVASTISKLTTYSAAKRARSMNIGESGFDEVVSGEHLTSGSTLGSDEWDMTNDMNNNSGMQAITLVTPGANLAALYAGEMLEALQLIVPSYNRSITPSNNWANTGSLTNWHKTAGRLWTNATSAGLYFTLAPAYAPMTADTVYNLTIALQRGSGIWEIQDYDGNALPTTAASVDGASADYIRTDNAAKTWSFQFTAPTGTSGGFKIISISSTANELWDDFTMTQLGQTTVGAGLVFKVGGPIDTTDTALGKAKGTVAVPIAPAKDDLFAVTGPTTVVYVGRDVGSYAWSAASVTSALTQTAANRARTATDSKEYALTYTVEVIEDIAPAGALALTVETFGTSTDMPLTAGEHTVYIPGASNASTAALVIQSVSSSSMTAGVLALSGFEMDRCCDSAANPDAGEWIGLKALGSDATVSATAVTGDDLSSVALSPEDPILRGRWSIVRCTSGKVAAYRL